MDYCRLRCLLFLSVCYFSKRSHCSKGFSLMKRTQQLNLLICFQYAMHLLHFWQSSWCCIHWFSFLNNSLNMFSRRLSFKCILACNRVIDQLVLIIKKIWYSYSCYCTLYFILSFFFNFEIYRILFFLKILNYSFNFFLSFVECDLLFIPRPIFRNNQTGDHS